MSKNQRHAKVNGAAALALVLILFFSSLLLPSPFWGFFGFATRFLWHFCIIKFACLPSRSHLQSHLGWFEVMSRTGAAFTGFPFAFTPLSLCSAASSSYCSKAISICCCCHCFAVSAKVLTSSHCTHFFSTSSSSSVCCSSSFRHLKGNGTRL